MTFPKKESKILYVLGIGLQLSFSIAVPILVFVFGGLWMDQTFHTSPLGSITGVIVGISASAYGVYNLLKPLLESNHSEN